MVCLQSIRHVLEEHMFNFCQVCGFLFWIKLQLMRQYGQLNNVYLAISNINNLNFRTKTTLFIKLPTWYAVVDIMIKLCSNISTLTLLFWNNGSLKYVYKWHSILEKITLRHHFYNQLLWSFNSRIQLSILLYVLFLPSDDDIQ